MVDIKSKSTIERTVSVCSFCISEELKSNNSISDFPIPDLSTFDFTKLLNEDETIEFYSHLKDSYFFDLLSNRFPVELLTGVIEKIKIIISDEINRTVIFNDSVIIVNSTFPISKILHDYDNAFISIFNRNSKNGFQEIIYLQSILFNRGNQLSNHRTFIFNNRKFKSENFHAEDLKDTESIGLEDKIVFYQTDAEDFILLDDLETEKIIVEKCVSCKRTEQSILKERKISNYQVQADKVITLIQAEQKLPFFSKINPEQLVMLQLLFLNDRSTEITHYNHFLKQYFSKHKHIEWFAVNSDLLTEEKQPNLFLNDFEGFSKILIEILRATLMWKKDKFLDIHSVNKLATSKLKIHDPFQVLGESAYRSQMLDWIKELEGKNFNNHEYGLKAIFK